MNPTTALALLISALASGAAALVTADHLSAIHQGAVARMVEVQSLNDQQTIEAAQALYLMATGKPADTIDELIAAGYLKESFRNHERVQTALPPLN